MQGAFLGGFLGGAAGRQEAKLRGGGRRVFRAGPVCAKVHVEGHGGEFGDAGVEFVGGVEEADEAFEEDQVCAVPFVYFALGHFGQGAGGGAGWGVFGDVGGQFGDFRDEGGGEPGLLAPVEEVLVGALVQLFGELDEGTEGGDELLGLLGGGVGGTDALGKEGFVAGHGQEQHAKLLAATVAAVDELVGGEAAGLLAIFFGREAAVAAFVKVGPVLGGKEGDAQKVQRDAQEGGLALGAGVLVHVEGLAVQACGVAADAGGGHLGPFGDEGGLGNGDEFAHLVHGGGAEALGQIVEGIGTLRLSRRGQGRRDRQNRRGKGLGGRGSSFFGGSSSFFGRGSSFFGRGSSFCGLGPSSFGRSRTFGRRRFRGFRAFLCHARDRRPTPPPLARVFCWVLGVFVGWGIGGGKGG